MKKIITLIIVGLVLISCSELSKEELIVHNQKVSLGMKKKKSDLNRRLSSFVEEYNGLTKKLKKVSSFKIGRSEAKKKQQIAEVKAEIAEISTTIIRIKKLKKELAIEPKEFGFQDDPVEVVENVFNAAKSKDFKTLVWLADPYDENDSDVDGIAYIDGLRSSQRSAFINRFKKGKVIGKPVIDTDKNTAKVDFMFGYKGNIKKTMNLVKRNENWYLASF